MIIGKKLQEHTIEVQEILAKTVKKIENNSIKDKNLINLSGTAFEKVVCDTLNELAKDYSLPEKFEQTTAHAFPDIYAKILEKKWFGIEVKTSQNDWKCFGNSIFESTKIPNIEDRIYVFFGKFGKVLKCKWGKYEECIDNINITHSPRYQINMELSGKPVPSIFNKMNISYLDFSNSNTSKRMDLVRKLKRKDLGENVALWWLPNNDSLNMTDERNLVIKLFSKLPSETKLKIRASALAYFPEIFSNNSDKYSRLPQWLASDYGVVMGNIRDLFSAGGGWEMKFKGTAYKIPKICFHAHVCAIEIKKIIFETNQEEQEELELKWGLSQSDLFTKDLDRLSYWIITVSQNLSQQPTMPQIFPIKSWLESIFE